MKYLGACAWLLAGLLWVAAIAPIAVMRMPSIVATLTATASEPGAWPMMLGGFILICSVLRRRRDTSLVQQAA